MVFAIVKGIFLEWKTIMFDLTTSDGMLLTWTNTYIFEITGKHLLTRQETFETIATGQ